MPLIDAHCHLDDEQFARDPSTVLRFRSGQGSGQALDAVIARAADAGVAAIITAGVDVASSRAAIALAERYEIVYGAVGIHPHHAASFSDATLEEIRTLAQQRKVVAVGEIGLDLHYADSAPREIQERNFIAHLDLADELDKPVVIHDRDAHRQVIEIIKRRGGKPRGILHCFSGDLEMARQAIELRYYISFAGTLTFPNARRLHEVARALPLESIIIETDAPYLSPQPRRGKRNEPANLAYIAAKIAELKNVTQAVVEETARRNCETLFGV